MLQVQGVTCSMCAVCPTSSTGLHDCCPQGEASCAAGSSCLFLQLVWSYGSASPLQFIMLPAPRQRRSGVPRAAACWLRRTRLLWLQASSTPSRPSDMVREIAVMKKLDHPNIVKLFEVSSARSFPPSQGLSGGTPRQEETSFCALRVSAAFTFTSTLTMQSHKTLTGLQPVHSA